MYSLCVLSCLVSKILYSSPLFFLSSCFCLGIRLFAKQWEIFRVAVRRYNNHPARRGILEARWVKGPTRRVDSGPPTHSHRDTGSLSLQILDRDLVLPDSLVCLLSLCFFCFLSLRLFNLCFFKLPSIFLCFSVILSIYLLSPLWDLIYFYVLCFYQDID